MEFSENFVDLMTITFTVIAILGIFLLTMQYNLLVQQDSGTMRAVLFAQSMMSAPCLTESSGGLPVRAVLSERKLSSENGREPSCMGMPSVHATVEAGALKWNWGSGGSSQADFDVAVKLADGSVVPGTLTVWG